MEICMLLIEMVILVVDYFIPFFVFLILLFDISLTFPIPLPIIVSLFSLVYFPPFFTSFPKVCTSYLA